jgi:8-oxo-dGTP diphosphatase
VEVLFVAMAILTYGGRQAGYRSGHWLAPTDPENPGRRALPIERRQGRLCLIAALVSYYGPALIFVGVHNGWAQVEPYLRDHLFDAFGCAALYVLIFRQFKQPFPQIHRADRLWRWLSRWLNIPIQLDAIQLSLASAAIGAASVFAAGGDRWAILGAGFLTGLILQGFWTGVISGVSGPGIVATVVVCDERVLLVRRRRQGRLLLLRTRGPFLWDFPAGRIQPDETAPHAAVRKAREEAAAVVAAREVLDERLDALTMRHVIFIACDLISEISHMAAENEATQIMWCDIDQFHRRYFSPDATATVRAYVDAALGAGPRGDS